MRCRVNLMRELTLVKISSRAIKYNLCAAGEAWINAHKLGTSKLLRSISSSSAGKLSIEYSFVVTFEVGSCVIESVAGVAWVLDSMDVGVC